MDGLDTGQGSAGIYFSIAFILHPAGIQRRSHLCPRGNSLYSRAADSLDLLQRSHFLYAILSLLGLFTGILLRPFQLGSILSCLQGHWDFT